MPTVFVVFSQHLDISKYQVMMVA